MTAHQTDRVVELATLRKRLAHLRGVLAAGEAKVAADRELLQPGRTTLPRTRQQVAKELETFTVYDGPMLREEIDKTERAIAQLEASQQPPGPIAILVPRGEPGSPVEEMRDRLRALHDQRRLADARLMDLRRAVDIALVRERGSAWERERLNAALSAMADLDRQIDAVGAEVKRLDAEMQLAAPR